MVGEGGQGGSGHGVDGAGGDEFGYVHGVGIGVVLDAGGGPERALRLGSEPGQLLPSLAGDDFLISLVGQAGVGDSRLPLELGGLAGRYLVEPGVDFGVHPGDEEGGDRADGGQVPAGGRGLFQAAQVGVHDGAVPGQGEDQGHVDADSLAGDLRDSGEAFGGGRDLHEHVVAVHCGPQGAGHVRGCGGVTGQPGVDLDGDPPVFSGCLPVHRGQDVTGGADVIGGDREDGSLGAGTQLGQVDSAGRHTGRPSPGPTRRSWGWSSRRRRAGR